MMEGLLDSPEGKTLEYKRDLSSLRPIMKTLVAFANTSGGVLVIGRESSGVIIGVPDVLAAEERLANAIADSIRPAMLPAIEIVTHGGKALILVRVPHWRGPFYVKGEGPEQGVYVRLGSTNRQAGPEILAEMQRALAGISYDSGPCFDSSSDDLDRERVLRAFNGQLLDDAKLETLGVLVRVAGERRLSRGG